MSGFEILDRLSEVRDLIDVAKNLYINKSRKDYNKVKKEVEKILKERRQEEKYNKLPEGLRVKKYIPIENFFEKGQLVNKDGEVISHSLYDLQDELIEHFQDYKDGIQLKKAQLRQRAAEIRERKEKRDAKRNRTVLAFLFVLLLIIIIISTTIRILND